MVEGLVRPTHVTDPNLLEALHAVPREMFVPAAAAGVAYIDDGISVGNGRRLAEPLQLARLLQAAEITGRDKVLDIGCATGYSTAVLARLAGTVIGLESDADLAGRASQALAAAGVTAGVVVGDLTAGLPGQAPYDAIVIAGAIAEVPEAILKQLVEGGRLVAIIIGGNDVVKLDQARLFRRIGNTFPSVPLFETSGSILPGFEPKPRFIF